MKYLLNGNDKCTVIGSFIGKVFLIRPGFKQECPNLDEAREFIRSKGWEMNIPHCFGSTIKRQIEQGRRE